MPAYFIVDLDIHDPAGVSAYAAAVGPVLEQFGAKYLVAGPKSEPSGSGRQLDSEEDYAYRTPRQRPGAGVLSVIGVSRDCRPAA